MRYIEKPAKSVAMTNGAIVLLQEKLPAGKACRLLCCLGIYIGFIIGKEFWVNMQKNITKLYAKSPITQKGCFGKAYREYGILYEGGASMVIIAGRQFLLFTIIVLGAITLVAVNRATAGKWTPSIRRMAGLDAVDEAVGRATEMGKPVHFAPGIGDVAADVAPQTFAGLEVLSHVTELTANYNTELIVTIRQPNVFPLAQEIVRQGYMAAGRPDMFKEDTVQFLSSEQFAYAAGVMGLMTRREVAANIMMGAFWAESLLFAEAGAQIGAIQVAGTAQMGQIPFFVAACDYTLIGEELYAAGAYLSQDKVKLGSIAGQDIIKAITMVIILLGSLLATGGSEVLLDLMSK